MLYYCTHWADAITAADRLARSTGVRMKVHRGSMSKGWLVEHASIGWAPGASGGGVGSYFSSWE